MSRSELTIDEQGEGSNLEAYLLQSEESNEETDSLVKSAFQVLKKRQCPPPKQYFFPISNKQTKLSKTPPSPCKVCSSLKHWDRECPYWEQYFERLKKKMVQVVSLQVSEGISLVEVYHAAYQALSQEAIITDN